MTDNNNLLKITNLAVEYHSDGNIFKAVNGVNLTLSKGETLGLVGETGAGKTTTALSIMGLLPERTSKVTSGKILFTDDEGHTEDLLQVSKDRLLQIRGTGISMIFQDPMTSLNPVITVGDQIREVYEIHRHDIPSEEIDNHVDQMLNLVGIDIQRKNEYPFQFSGGMKQRIVIAIALACRPMIILADEPTSALDVTIQAQVLKLMYELKQELQTSMILITHDLGVVAQVCDKVAIMYAGKIVEQGTVQDIFNHKTIHPYTKGLFASIPNLNEKVDRLSPIKGLMPDPTSLPVGCSFNPRCPFAYDLCTKQEPENLICKTHQLACHLYQYDAVADKLVNTKIKEGEF